MTNDLDIDPEVATRLSPLAEVETPDVWSLIDDSEFDRPFVDDGLGGAPDFSLVALDDVAPTADRPWVRPLLMAAGVAALVLAGVALLPRSEQRLENPADQPAPATQPAADGADVDADPSAVNSGYPQEVEIGPDRTAMSSVPPHGSFFVVFDAGAVVVTADGEVLGHYPGGIPEFMFPEDNTFFDVLPPPDGCQYSSIRADTRIYFCSDEVGPTVEIVDDDLTRRPLASFPLPENQGTVPGQLTDGFFAPVAGRAGPMLLQWSQDVSGTAGGCDTNYMAMMVDSAAWATTQVRGGTIRHLDGSSWWDGGTSDAYYHQSRPVGWSAEGDEAYVWQYNGGCHEEIAIEEGVYGYQLDGSSRLLFPVHPDVRQIRLFSPPADVAVNPSDGQAEGPDLAAESPEQWEAWAGPLKVSFDGPESAVADPQYGIDAELVMGFAADELGMSNPTMSVAAGEPAGWILTEDSLTVWLRPNNWFRGETPTATELRQWTVRTADTFLPDEDDFLSARVGPDPGTGIWHARFTVPGLDAEAQATYVMDDITYGPSVAEAGDPAEISFGVLSEPTEPAVLTISWYRDGRLVAYRRATIPPGEFSAG